MYNDIVKNQNGTTQKEAQPTCDVHSNDRMDPPSNDFQELNYRMDPLHEEKFSWSSYTMP